MNAILMIHNPIQFVILLIPEQLTSNFYSQTEKLGELLKSMLSDV